MQKNAMPDFQLLPSIIFVCYELDINIYNFENW